MIDNTKEYILCAAVQYYGEKLVFCGYRHSDCYQVITSLCPDIEKLSSFKQGFLTSKNRFVSRSEAAEIAFRAGQIGHFDPDEPFLISEDLY